MVVSKCTICYRFEVNNYSLYEYQDKIMCSDCISRLAKLEKDYKAEREDEEEEYDLCSLCGRLYAYLIRGEFNDQFCIKCLGTKEMPRGETYRLALWTRYLDRQAKKQDDFYDGKRFK